jgi:hypothetical protein
MRTRWQQWRLRPEHTAAGCARVNADFDAGNYRLIQIDIDGHARRIPHARRATTAARAVDARERPVDLTNRTRRCVYGSLARLGQTRALVRLQPGSPNANSALSKRVLAFPRKPQPAGRPPMRIVTMLMVPGHELWRDLRAQRHHAHHDAGTDARRKGRDTSCEQDDGKASASSGCMRAGAKRHRPQRERCEPDGGSQVLPCSHRDVPRTPPARAHTEQSG